MTIIELIQVFQSFSGETLYVGTMSARHLDFTIILMNVLSIIFFLIVIVVTFVVGIHLKGCITDDFMYMDKNGKQFYKKDVAPHDIEQYEKVFMRSSLPGYLIVLITCIVCLSIPILKHKDKYEVISFYDDHILLKKDSIYIFSLFKSEKVHYDNIKKITVYSDVEEDRSGKRVVKFNQCVFEIYQNDHSVVNFAILEKDIKLFNLNSCIETQEFKKSDLKNNSY